MQGVPHSPLIPRRGHRQVPSCDRHDDCFWEDCQQGAGTLCVLVMEHRRSAQHISPNHAASLRSTCIGCIPRHSLCTYLDVNSLTPSAPCSWPTDIPPSVAPPVKRHDTRRRESTSRNRINLDLLAPLFSNCLRLRGPWASCARNILRGGMRACTKSAAMSSAAQSSEALKYRKICCRSSCAFPCSAWRVTVVSELGGLISAPLAPAIEGFAP